MSAPTPIISRMTLIQPSDACDHIGDIQELNIEFLSEGGHYIVLSTERWALR